MGRRIKFGLPQAKSLAGVFGLVRLLVPWARAAPVLGVVLTYAEAMSERRSQGRALFQGAEEEVFGYLGLSRRGSLCGETFATAGIGAVACPALVVGLALAGSVGGEKIGSVTADRFGLT